MTDVATQPMSNGVSKKEHKKRKARFGSKLELEGKRQQRAMHEDVLPKATFERMIDEVSKELGFKETFTPDARHLLQQIVETMQVQFFRRCAHLLVNHPERYLTTEHMNVVRRILDDEDPCFKDVRGEAFDKVKLGSAPRVQVKREGETEVKREGEEEEEA